MDTKTYRLWTMYWTRGVQRSGHRLKKRRDTDVDTSAFPLYGLLFGHNGFAAYGLWIGHTVPNGVWTHGWTRKNQPGSLTLWTQRS